jgi:hypothetical protein
VGERSGREPSSFFGQATLFLLLMLGTSIIIGHGVGRLYRPLPLSPAPERVVAADRFVLLFGNSRFEAGIDPERLAHGLSASSRVDAAMFTGGGWDVLHYYMLALLARDTLRPWRDAVVIEVSPLSMNDAQCNNRLGVIRPETALEVAGLPREPAETRLSILLGAVVGLYRYRDSIQQGPLDRGLTVCAGYLSVPLVWVGFLGPPRAEPSFRLIPAPGREYVIQEIQGDMMAFQAANRRRLQATLRTLRFGAFMLRALERAVVILREKNIDVYLVSTPLSRWFQDRVDGSPAGLSFKRALERLASETGAEFLKDWPEHCYDERNFWDDTHMTSQATKMFTDAVAKRLRSGRR